MSSDTISENAHYDLKAFFQELRHGVARLVPQLLKKLGICVKKSEKSRHRLDRRKISLKINQLLVTPTIDPLLLGSRRSSS